MAQRGDGLMDSQLGIGQDVVGEYVGMVTDYQPTAQTATVRLRVPVPRGTLVRISSDESEWEERVRRVKRRQSGSDAAAEVEIKVHQPVPIGAEVYRLWQGRLAA
jgi:hypothetical protein